MSLSWKITVRKFLTVDRNELMKERVKLEKSQKNGEKMTDAIQVPGANQKRKNSKAAGGQKKKTRKNTG